MIKKGRELKDFWDTFIVDGDSAAFYALYAHYHDYLSYLAFKKGANPERTKDAINDLFLYVYENRLQLNHILHHHNYLITSFLRKLFRKEHFSAEESQDLFNVEETQTIPSAESEHIWQNTNEQVANMLKTYIEKLSASQAQVIYQKFYLGLSYEEISELNQISIKTAYNTVYNAVEKLKKMMGNDRVTSFFMMASIISLLFLFFLKFCG